TQQALEQVEAAAPPEAADAPDRVTAKAKALRGLAWSYLSQGDNQKAIGTAEQSAAWFRRGRALDKRGLAYALIVMGQAQYFLGMRDEADAVLREAMALARAANDVYGECWAMGLLVRVKAVLYGDLDTARAYAEESIRLAHEAAFPYLTSVLSYNLALLAAHRQDAVEARLRFQEAIAAFEATRAHFNVLLAKSDLAHLERSIGNFPRALELYRETIISFRDVGQRGAVVHQLECFAFILIAQIHLDRPVLRLGPSQAWRERARTRMTA